MAVGKIAGVTAGFIGALALGIAIGPSVQERLFYKERPAAAQPTVTLAEEAPAPTSTRTRVSPPRARPNEAVRKSSASSVSIPLSEPRLHDKLKPVLNRGARMEIAADGFRSAEEFATVAHAARNTNLPFMVLKHRVLSEGRTLANAIQEAKPDVDPKAEVVRARAAAKADLAAVGG
ncbi:MAG: hypothetical protein GEU82_04440 [Luteitalea sp.]|nr:hypothetical protein [Luteitalea sp.]